MAIDSEQQVIYLSGGRIVGGDWGFAGMFSFDIRRGKWKTHLCVYGLHYLFSSLLF